MFAVPGKQPDYDLEYAPDLDTAFEQRGDIHVCSQCAPRRGLTAGHLRPGADIAGAATLVRHQLGEKHPGPSCTGDRFGEEGAPEVSLSTKRCMSAGGADTD